MSSVLVDNHYNDNELVLRAKSGDSVALSMLIEKYSSKIFKMSHSFKNTNGIDADDLYQEGMIGFVSSIYSFDESYGVKFYTFSSTVAYRKMLSSLRKTSDVLDSCIDLYSSLECDVDTSVQYPSPEEFVLFNEELNELMNFAKENFSKTEKKVFKLLLLGISYSEIADILDCGVKSVDNAVQRIRRKIRTFKSDE